jgi:hypothetical protein
MGYSLAYAVSYGFPYNAVALIIVGFYFGLKPLVNNTRLFKLICSLCWAGFILWFLFSIVSAPLMIIILLSLVEAILLFFYLFALDNLNMTSLFAWMLLIIFFIVLIIPVQVIHFHFLIIK